MRGAGAAAGVFAAGALVVFSIAFWRKRWLIFSAEKRLGACISAAVRG